MRPPPTVLIGGVCGSRSPCRRMTGQNVPYWNQRANTSRNASSSGLPPWKPPMSVVHHGMPAMPMCRPAANWLRKLSKLEWMSPDQTSAPYFCEPAHAQRRRFKIFFCPSFSMPS